jgi:hypothetical protein
MKTVKNSFHDCRFNDIDFLWVAQETKFSFSVTEKNSDSIVARTEQN